MKKIAEIFYATLLSLILGVSVGVVPVNAKSPVTRDDIDMASPWQATPTADGSYMHDFAVDFYLTRDEYGVSHLRVVETIEATFPSGDWTHGLVRVVPFTNQSGTNLTMKSDNEITLSAERNGSPEPVAKVENGDGFFRVYFGDTNTYLHGDQVYTLEYEFENVITEQTGKLARGISEWQELYWDTNGNDWGNSFDRVTATIHMDRELANEYLNLNTCYVGKWGESGTTRCDIEENDDNTVITFSADQIDSYENLTFVLAFKPNTFVIPEKPKDYGMLILAGVVAITGGIILIFVAKKYQLTKEKRNYYKNQFVKPEYAPLPDLTVAEMKTNSIKSCHGNSAVATLMELAVTGKVAIHKTARKGVLKNKNIWSIEILSDNLLPEQRSILKILNGAKDFKNGEQFELQKHDYDNAASRLMTSFNDQVESRLKDLGLLEDKEKAKIPGSSRIIISITLWEFFSTMFLAMLDDSKPYQEVVGGNLLPVIIFIMIFVPILSLILMLTAENYQKHTEKGLTTARYFEGLKLYVKMAESERIKFLQSVDGVDVSHQGIVKLYEKLLPYAIIFGLEKSWLKEMGRYYEFDDVSDPVWYVGMGAFVASDFSSAVSEMSSFASTSIAHSTTDNSSSGGSGFSSGGGGGFSGGGGGGGGGGTW